MLRDPDSATHTQFLSASLTCWEVQHLLELTSAPALCREHDDFHEPQALLISVNQAIKLTFYNYFDIKTNTTQEGFIVTYSLLLYSFLSDSKRNENIFVSPQKYYTRRDIPFH